VAKDSTVEEDSRLCGSDGSGSDSEANESGRLFNDCAGVSGIGTILGSSTSGRPGGRDAIGEIKRLTGVVSVLFELLPSESEVCCREGAVVSTLPVILWPAGGTKRLTGVVSDCNDDSGLDTLVPSESSLDRCLGVLLVASVKLGGGASAPLPLPEEPSALMGIPKRIRL